MCYTIPAQTTSFAGPAACEGITLSGIADTADSNLNSAHEGDEFCESITGVPKLVSVNVLRGTNK